MYALKIKFDQNAYKKSVVTDFKVVFLVITEFRQILKKSEKKRHID